MQSGILQTLKGILTVIRRSGKLLLFLIKIFFIKKKENIPALTIKIKKKLNMLSIS